MELESPKVDRNLLQNLTDHKETIIVGQKVMEVMPETEKAFKAFVNQHFQDKPKCAILRFEKHPLRLEKFSCVLKKRRGRDSGAQ